MCSSRINRGRGLCRLCRLRESSNAPLRRFCCAPRVRFGREKVVNIVSSHFGNGVIIFRTLSKYLLKFRAANKGYKAKVNLPYSNQPPKFMSKYNMYVYILTETVVVAHGIKIVANYIQTVDISDQQLLSISHHMPLSH